MILEKVLVDKLEMLKDKNRRIKIIDWTAWNPLGEQAQSINDLDNYNTEAHDIYFHFVSEIQFPKKNNPLKRAQLIIKEVINEAFNLWRSDKDCEDSAIKIMEILK